MENSDKPATLKNMMMKSTASLHVRTSTAAKEITIDYKNHVQESLNLAADGIL
jgi:hypothetical protein